MSDLNVPRLQLMLSIEKNSVTNSKRENVMYEFDAGDLDRLISSLESARAAVSKLSG